MQGFRLELPCVEEQRSTAPSDFVGCGFQLNVTAADTQPTLHCFDLGASAVCGVPGQEAELSSPSFQTATCGTAAYSAAGPAKRFRRSSQSHGGQAFSLDGSSSGGQTLLDWDAPTLKQAAAGIPSQLEMPFPDLCRFFKPSPVLIAPEDRCDLWEVYSRPRMSPVMREMGGRAARSYDLAHYWDFNEESYQRLLIQDVGLCRPRFIMLSPPCTHVCALQHSNWGRMPPGKRMLNLKQACHHLDFTSWIAHLQSTSEEYFGFEHPDGSLAWGRSSVTWPQGSAVVRWSRLKRPLLTMYGQ